MKHWILAGALMAPLVACDEPEPVVEEEVAVPEVAIAEPEVVEDEVVEDEEPTAEDLPIADDFEEGAAEEITEENYTSVLDDLEEENETLVEEAPEETPEEG